MPDSYKTSLLVNLAVGLGGVIILAPLIIFIGFDISGRAEKIQEQKRELISRTRTVDFLARLKSDSEKAADYSSFLTNVLPARDQLIGFSKDLEALAKKNQVDSGFSFGAETASTETEPGATRFILTASPTYNNFVKLLKTVEASQYFVGFEAINLERKGKDYKSVSNGRVFYR